MRLAGLLVASLIGLAGQAIGLAAAAPLPMLQIASGVYVHRGVQEDANLRTGTPLPISASSWATPRS